MGLMRRAWTENDVLTLVGDHHGSWVGYAADVHWQEKAASGGSVTALLSWLLSSKRIDGAVVCRTVAVNGAVRAQFELARDSRELEGTQSSFYAATDFAHDVPRLLEKATGRIAVVGLPCDLRFLTHRLAKMPLKNCDVVLKIALFCSHVSRNDAVDVMTTDLARKAKSTLVSFTFREGPWRGRLKASFADGTSTEKHGFYFRIYSNLYFFCAKKCLSCHDHFGYYADLAFGDLWLMRMRHASVKHSSIIAKTPQGMQMLLAGKDALVLRDVPITKILDGQRRGVLTHHNVTARKRVGRLLGVRVVDEAHCRVGLADLMVAAVFVLNYRISQSPAATRILMSLPRWLLKPYLYGFKAIECCR